MFRPAARREEQPNTRRLLRFQSLVIGLPLRIRAALAVSMIVPRLASAQVARDSSVDWLVSAGSEGERYLRVLQVAGLAPYASWSVRPFSGNALRQLAPRDTTHPWNANFALRGERSVTIELLQPELLSIVNSTFPYGYNDGAVWAGKGLTLAAMGGVRGRVGPLSFVVAPQVFAAQNAGFPLAPTGRVGRQAFGDAHSGGIDLPQRFGAGIYERLDPGQSVLQLSGLHLTVGGSTANEYWGPAAGEPFLLGNNAAGFVHAFAGTDGPVVLGPVQLNLRLIAGRLDQSPYSYADSADRRRFVTGMVVSVGVRQIPGLEIGAGRLFENFWPDSGFGLSDVVSPLFRNLLKSKLDSRSSRAGNGSDNQLASVFGRWVFPSSGVEVYGEYGREDNSWDLRDLLVEPDHDVAFMLGLSRVWRRPAGRLLVLRAELLNGAVSHLSSVRAQTPAYVHTPIVQGHTQLGQILGAPAGYGGGAATLAADYYAQGGRFTLSWRRAMREPPLITTSPRDVMHALSADALFLRGRVDLAPEATLVYNANRNGGAGVLNARLALAARAHW